MFAFTVLVDTGEVISEMPLWLDITLSVLGTLLFSVLLLCIAVLMSACFEKIIKPKIRRYINYRDNLAAQKPIQLDAVYRDRQGTRVTVIGQVTRYDGRIRIITWEGGHDIYQYSLEEFNTFHKRRLCHFPVWW